ncbi:MAG: hypothetical protein ACRC9L_00100 [Brevinema sp.]
MKKVLFFIPAIIFALFYGFLAITAIGAISPIVIGWLALFLVAGVLLSRTVFWGSLLGVLPAIHLIYMSTQETGQVVNIELPLGIIVLLFYVICGYFVYKKRVAKPKQ